MVGFKERKLESLTLGEKLKKIRLDSNISLAEISSHTKIRKDYLEKIETGKFNELPFDVYVKGYLKSYAKYLNLNPDKVIDQFNKEIGVRENIRRYQERGKEKFKINFPSITITPKAISISLSIIVSLIGFFYFYFEIDSFSKKPTLEIESPSSDKVVSEKTINLIGLTEPENKIKINGEIVMVGSDGRFIEAIGLENGNNEITIEALNKFDKKSFRVLNIVYKEQETVVLKTKEEKEETEGFTIEIEARNEKSDITIKTDDGEKQENNIVPGINIILKILDKVEITSSKPGNIYVKINDDDFFVLDENQENKNIFIINKEGIVKNEEINKN